MWRLWNRRSSRFLKTDLQRVKLSLCLAANTMTHGTFVTRYASYVRPLVAGWSVASISELHRHQQNLCMYFPVAGEQLRDGPTRPWSILYSMTLVLLYRSGCLSPIARVSFPLAFATREADDVGWWYRHKENRLQRFCNRFCSPLGGRLLENPLFRWCRTRIFDNMRHHVCGCRHGSVAFSRWISDRTRTPQLRSCARRQNLLVATHFCRVCTQNDFLEISFGPFIAADPFFPCESSVGIRAALSCLGTASNLSHACRTVCGTHAVWGIPAEIPSTEGVASIATICSEFNDSNGRSTRFHWTTSHLSIILAAASIRLRCWCRSPSCTRLPLQSPWLNCLARFTSVMHLHYELGSVLLDSLF